MIGVEHYLAHMAIRGAEEKDEDGAEIRRIRGVASTGIIDRQGTIVDPKSLAKAAKLYDRRKGKMFWNHTWAVPIGVREKIEYDAENKRLLFQGRIGSGFPVPIAVGGFGMPVLMNVDDLWKIIKQDLTSSLSIAFLANETKGELDERTGERAPSLLEVTDLLEVSVVTIPANPDAEFAVTRAFEDQAYRAAMARSSERPPSRDELWGLRLDGAAAAAAVDTGSADQGEDVDPVELLDRAADPDWARVREELERCRLSLRTTS